jgi:thymidine phosphorylase
MSRIDPAAGLTLHKKIGDLVIEGEPLVTLFAQDTARIDAVRAGLAAAISIEREAPTAVPLVRLVIEDQC